MTDQELLIACIIGGIAIIMMVSGLAGSRAIKDAENRRISDTQAQQTKIEMPKQNTNVTTVQEPTKKCIFCGASVLKNQKFCGHCGRRLD